MDFTQVRPVTFDKRFQRRRVRVASQCYININDRFIEVDKLDAESVKRLQQILPKGVSYTDVIGFLNTALFTKFKKGAFLLSDRLIFVDSGFKVKGTTARNVIPFKNLVSADPSPLSPGTIVLRYMKEYKPGAATYKVTLHCSSHKTDLLNFFHCLLFDVGEPKFEEEVEVIPVKTLSCNYHGIDRQIECPDIGLPNYIVTFAHMPLRTDLFNMFIQFNSGLSYANFNSGLPTSLLQMNYRSGYQYFYILNKFDWEPRRQSCTYYYSSDLFYDVMLLEHADVLIYAMTSNILDLPEVLEHYRKCARRFEHPVVYLADGYRFNAEQRESFTRLLVGDDLFSEPRILFGDLRELSGCNFESYAEAFKLHTMVKKVINHCE